MDRIDALLEKATPNFQRREHLRNVFREWERVENLAGSHVVQVSATDAEELEQIREELATAGVPPGRRRP